MKPQLALVRYTSDKKRDVVSVQEVCQFHPKTVNDFDAKKVYQVKCSVVRRSESDQHDEHFTEPYRAKILLLAVNGQSMVASAKKHKETLPSGYTERVKRELREQNNSQENVEKRKTSKEILKALRQSDQERMKNIINTNLQEKKKTEDHVNVSTIGKVPVCQLDQESPLVMSNSLVSQSNQENLLVNANVSVAHLHQNNVVVDSNLNDINPAEPGPKIDVTHSLQQVKYIETTSTANQEDKGNSKSPLMKELSSSKLEETIDKKHSPGSNSDNDVALSEVSHDKQQLLFPQFSSISFFGKPSLGTDSNFKRDLFDTKKARKSEEDTETDSCSYQSSSSIIKELESKVVSLQLNNQSLKKRNSMLNKCLNSALQVMMQESEDIKNILSLHGDNHIKIVGAEAVTVATSRSWTVVPSPVKGCPKLRTPAKPSGSSPSQSSSNSTLKEKTSSSKKRTHSSDHQDNSTPMKSRLVSFDFIGSPIVTQSPDSLTKAHNLERTPQKSTEKLNGVLSPGSSKKKVEPSASKNPQSLKKLETPSKSNKNKKKSKFENTLKPGEVKAEVLSNDLLKVLKKERDIQMNENRSKVCIGNNTWIKKGVWRDKFSKTSTNIKKLVNELAEEVWGISCCGNLSLTGGVSPKTPGAAQKPPAPAGKVEAIFGLCRAHLIWQGMTNPDHLDHSLTQCRLYLRNMFNEAARKLKRDENKMKHTKEDED